MFNKLFIGFFLFLFVSVFAQKDYKILLSTSNELIVEYRPFYQDTIRFSQFSSEYISFQLSGGEIENISEPGVPQKIVKYFNIGVPQEFGNNIRILESSFDLLDSKLLPVPNIRKIEGMPQFEYLESANYSDYVNPELVSFGEFGLVRDIPIQTLKIYPIQFDANQNKIKLYKKIIFKITFAPTLKKQKINDLSLLKEFVINADAAKYWSSEKFELKKTNQQSLLSQGDWYRFEAPTEGIYRIDKAFLTAMGINVSNLDPRTLKIYNNGGYHLSWNQNDVNPNELIENAILVSGEEDGVFNDNDYVLFYGRGVDFWEFNTKLKKVIRNKHFYSKKNYYWLTYGGEVGKRMNVKENISDSPNKIINSTLAYIHKDEDKQNLIKSGLLYVGDDFTYSVRSNTYTEMLHEHIADSTINYAFQFVNGSKKANVLTVEENGVNIFSKLLAGPSSLYIDYRYGAMEKNFASYKGTLPNNRSVLKFTYQASSVIDKGHLDFYEIIYHRKLMAVDNKIIFYSKPYDGILEYRVNGFSGSDIIVFNVSDYSNVELVKTEISAGEFNFRSNESSNTISKYFATHSSGYMVPVNQEKVNNSNIRGISPGAKYIIITHRNFANQAERLKNFRSNESKFKVLSKVVYLDEIYNEFSGGSLDPTAIRNFLKYGYENWNVKPEYVLLFGDGDFDYFNVEGKGLNFIPTFQTIESLYELESYPYDDYYSRIVGNDSKADLAIGRLNVTSETEAKIVVDKIIKYETELDKGLWRNKITLLADDGLAGFANGRVTDDGALHTNQSEYLAQNNIPNSFDLNKIYLSNYQTINTGIGRRKPDCNTSVLEAMNNGTLIFNFIGHGNPDVWTHEIVFDRNVSIPQLRNKEYFFLTAATCDFGKYDDPYLQSATEEMILLENAGMIGGMSAVRPVFSGQNAALNQVFYSYLLGSKDSLGFPVSVGFAYWKLKSDRISTNDEKFHLFGDPYLRLNIPSFPVSIETINDNNLQNTIQIKALSTVSIKGSVLNTDNTLSNFNGETIISVYDSKRNIFLDDIKYNMEAQGGVIFRGRASVENGKFALSFTVPKDISYDNKNGKILAYFFNDQYDGIGFTNKIIVGGTDSSNINDNKGPEIQIFYDDDETQSSYLVNSNFKLRIKLFDETGLNTTGTGIGHKLEAILNNDEKNSIDLTDFFIGDLDSGGKSGEVNYNFSALNSGDYKLRINAWDVFNNFSSQESYFTVVDDNNLLVRDVYNYPNPFKSNTYFTFQHNLNNSINVKIKIYTVAGRIIKEISADNITDKFVKISWDGRDEDNNAIANGTYLYKLLVQSEDGKFKENVLGKMAVIR